MSVTTPLTSEQVFMIASPAVTMRSISEKDIPSVKVDLKSRLVIEMNKQMLSATGRRKEELKKQYKKVMMDKMSKEQEHKLLNEFIESKQNIPFDNAKVLKMNKLIVLNTRLIKLKEEYDTIVEDKRLYDEGDRSKHKTLKPLVKKVDAAETAFNLATQKFIDVEGEYKTIESEHNKYNTTLLQRPEQQAEIDRLNQSIVEISDEQKQIETKMKTDLDANINPAIFEKTTAERIAESNELFRGVFNQGVNPHITMPFEEIAALTDINQIFVEAGTGRISNMVLIIYRSEEDFGHWVALTRSPDLRRLDYFNSYGTMIDAAIDYIPEQIKISSGQNFEHLAFLLSKCSYEVHYNDKQLQPMDGKSSTCGRFAGLWMRVSTLGKTMEEFTLPFEVLPLEERDQLIVKLTQPYLNET